MNSAYGTFVRTETAYTNLYFPRSIIDFTTGDRDRKFHPTCKPVPLLEYLIRTYTDEGNTVLDNTMGSGSTGVACVQTGRHFVGIELLNEYYTTALERIKTAHRANDGATEAVKEKGYYIDEITLF